MSLLYFIPYSGLPFLPNPLSDIHYCSLTGSPLNLPLYTLSSLLLATSPLHSFQHLIHYCTLIDSPLNLPPYSLSVTTSPLPSRLHYVSYIMYPLPFLLCSPIMPYPYLYPVLPDTLSLHIHMSFAGWEVSMVKNCDQDLEV